MARPRALGGALFGLSLSALAATAQDAPRPLPAPAPPPAEAVDPSLSPECRVPGSRLYSIASLRAVKSALKENRAVNVLSIGASSTIGMGTASAVAHYPNRLQGELERLFPGIEVSVTNRSISGAAGSGAAQRLRNAVADADPDLVVWQVGTNDALARVDLDVFAQRLDETVKWLKSHEIDLVLVDPQYTEALARDDHYGRVVGVIRSVAQANRIPLVLRYEAMRYLAGRGKDLGKDRGESGADRFNLSDLGYRCMAEHVARAITLSLVETDAGAAATPSATPAAAALSK